ncbi:hypothetical protein SANTM175S_02004 [Streptomyces antimycoticus]
MSEAIDHALGHARVNSDEIDYVNAHGLGTKQNDRHEHGGREAVPWASTRTRPP